MIFVRFFPSGFNCDLCYQCSHYQLEFSPSEDWFGGDAAAIGTGQQNNRIAKYKNEKIREQQNNRTTE